LDAVAHIVEIGKISLIEINSANKLQAPSFQGGRHFIRRGKKIR
jgi:hypothetical protein